MSVRFQGDEAVLPMAGDVLNKKYRVLFTADRAHGREIQHTVGIRSYLLPLSHLS